MAQYFFLFWYFNSNFTVFVANVVSSPKVAAVRLFAYISDPLKKINKLPDSKKKLKKVIKMN